MHAKIYLVSLNGTKIQDIDSKIVFSLGISHFLRYAENKFDKKVKIEKICFES